MERTRTFHATLNRQGRLTIPAEVRERMQLHEGEAVEIEIIDDHTFQVHAQFLVNRDQAWVWSEQWSSQIRESMENVARGESRLYTSDEEFLSSLDEG